MSRRYFPMCRSCLALLLGLLSLQSALGQSSAKKQLRGQAAEDTLDKHYQAARTYSVVGDPDRADTEYRAFLDEALHRLAMLKINEGDYSEGYRLFEEAIAMAPEDVSLRTDYGTALYQQNQMDNAKAQAEQAVKVKPDGIKAQYLLGRVLYAMGD